MRKNRIHKLLRGAAWLGLLLLLLAGIFGALLVIRLGLGLKPWEAPYGETGEQEEGITEEAETEGEREEPEAGTEAGAPAGNGTAADEENGREETDQEEEQDRGPLRLMMVSDLHYLSPGTHDGGEAFRKMMWEEDDGKPDPYSEEMVDALLDEAVRQQPSALILAGDITHNGEKQSHLELAEKLRQVCDAGVPVLVIPGNHDIRNSHASLYSGGERIPAKNLESGEEFYGIYREFGYDSALSMDENSLSYVYALDENHWVMMLDSCRYEQKNLVSGRIRQETLVWMEEQLEAARELGVQVLPVVHHNLLEESRLYKTECTLENSGEVTALLEGFRVPLCVSGHLHAQRIKKHKTEPGTEETEYGITEIVLGPYSIPPCEYGILEWGEDGSMEFSTAEADVERWAAEQGLEDEFLLSFSEEAPELTKQVIRFQMRDHHLAISEDLEDRMLELYGNLYLDYCSGRPIDRRSVVSTLGYEMWMRVGPDSRYAKELEEMMKDSARGSREWTRTEDRDPGEKPS